MSQIPQTVQFNQSPVVSLAKFAELSGFPAQVVRGWADKGLLPTRKIGRHRVVDLVMLASGGVQQ